jgi:membrane fusion protein (multidrug efflux system)
LILNEIDDAIMVPTIAIIPVLNGQKVYKVVNGVVEESTIQTGIRTSEKVQIIKGASHGDVILTTGLLQVRPGMEVEITDLKKTSEL